MALDDHLKSLEESGLVKVGQLEPELEYLFKHALVQDAAYASLLRQDRKTLHREVGEVLERLYPDRIEELAARLGGHFEEADDAPRALGYFVMAGDAALKRYAVEEAIMAYEHALKAALKAEADHDTLLSLFSNKGRAEELAGRYADAIATYTTMGETGRKNGDRSLEMSSLSAQATIYSTYTPFFNPEKAIETNVKSLALAKELGDEPEEAHILWNQLLVFRTVGRLEEASQAGEQSLEIARRLNLRQQIAFSLHDMGTVIWYSKQSEKALGYLDEARAMWEELGNKAMLADNLTTSTEVLSALGRHDEALARAEQAYEISVSINNVWGQGYSQMTIAMIELARGKVGKSFQTARAALEKAKIVDFGFPLVAVRSIIAMVLGEMGAFEEAYEHVSAAEIDAPRLMPTMLPFPQLTRAYLTLLEGDFDRADQMLQDIDVTSPNLDSVVLEFAPIIQGAIYFHREQYDRVLAQPAISDKALSIMSMSPVALMAITQRINALIALDRLDEAGQVIDAARQAQESAGLKVYLWELEEAAARLAEKRGDEIARRAHLEQARASLEFLIEQIGDAALIASFKNRPLVKRLMESIA